MLSGAWPASARCFLLVPGSQSQQPAMVLLLGVVLVVRAPRRAFFHQLLPSSLAVRDLKKPCRCIFPRPVGKGQKCFWVRKPIPGRLPRAFRTPERTPVTPSNLYYVCSNIYPFN
ncbi:hypothetical protein NDU88_003401 [Pleurodeles waltl]|uniref:Secreted protein n=1 Tax=Pleurodeles waltl TaxID=8319 RepID=A0AAV7KWX3_PLEWA|nr:hypothetical protein NDU88_003401 [Pleurodeles waltl]